jgi:hypothetical protein
MHHDNPQYIRYIWVVYDLLQGCLWPPLPGHTEFHTMKEPTVTLLDLPSSKAWVSPEVHHEANRPAAISTTNIYQSEVRSKVLQPQLVSRFKFGKVCREAVLPQTLQLEV